MEGTSADLDTVILRIPNPYNDKIKDWIKGCDTDFTSDITIRGIDSPPEGIPAIIFLISRILILNDENRNLKSAKIISVPFSHFFVQILVAISQGKDFEATMPASVFMMLRIDMNRYIASHEHKCIELNTRFVEVFDSIKLSKETVNRLLLRDKYFSISFLPSYSWKALDSYFSTPKKELFDMLMEIICNTPNLKDREGAYKLFFIVLIYLYHEEKKGKQTTQVPQNAMNVLITIVPRITQEQLLYWLLLSFVHVNSVSFCRLVQLLSHSANYMSEITESEIQLPNYKNTDSRETLYNGALKEIDKCSSSISSVDIVIAKNATIERSKRQRSEN